MKKTLAFILTIALLISIATVAAGAETVYTEGTLKYTISNESITITSCFGKDETVVVPAMIAGIPVNKIAAGAFADNKNIKRVELPDTIISVGEYAFPDGATVVYNANTDHPDTIVPTDISGGEGSVPSSDGGNSSSQGGNSQGGNKGGNGTTGNNNSATNPSVEPESPDGNVSNPGTQSGDTPVSNDGTVIDEGDVILFGDDAEDISPDTPKGEIAENAETTENSSSATLWIVCSVVGVLVIAAAVAAVIIIRKKKK